VTDTDELNDHRIYCACMQRVTQQKHGYTGWDENGFLNSL